MGIVTWRRLLASALLSIASAAACADTWLFDFGAGTQTSGPNYNNITNPEVHNFPGLVNASGITTGASLAVTVPFNGGSVNTNGTTTPAAELGFAATATRDSFFGNTEVFLGRTAPNAQIVLSGLDKSQLYDFTLFASRMGVTDNRQTEYKATGANVQTATLDPSGNTSAAARLLGIQPRADGSIVLDLRAGVENVNSNHFYYLGAMRIESSAPPLCGNDDPALDDKLTAYPAGSGSYTLGHWLYRPAGYSHAPCNKLPLLVVLHGAGDRCPGAPLAALNKSSNNMPGYQIQSGSAYAAQRPFLQGLVLQPQTCEGSWSAQSIDAMIEYVKSSTNRVDEDRIYVSGLSLGGGGTWTYAAAHAGKLAAIVPIAGTEKALSTIHAASHVPTWAFHNFNDTNVGSGLAPPTSLFRCKSHTHRECTIEHVDRMIPFASQYVMAGYSADGGATMAATHRIARLTTAGEALPTQWLWESAAAPQGAASATMLTVFAASGHGGWSTAYGMPEMWSWLYGQRRSAQPTVTMATAGISPSTAAVNSGATVNITARIASGGPAPAEIWVDLKKLNGPYNAKMSLVPGSATNYQLSYTLPATGLAAGAKGIGVVAVDATGNRSIKYVTLTLQ